MLVPVILIAHRGLIAECIVELHAVVEGFEVIEDNQPVLVPRGEAVAGDKFGFESASIALRVGVVEIVGTAAHARGDAAFA